MKKFSKILSVALLVALVLSLGVANAFAAGTHSVTINPADGDTATHSYGAYQIFAGKTTADPDDNSIEDLTFGAAVPADKQAAFITALKGISGTTAFDALTETSTAAQVAAAIGTYATGYDTAPAQAVATAIGGYITAQSISPTTTSSGSFTGLAEGYYFFKDLTNPDDQDETNNAYGASTRFILDVVTDLTITAKASVPEVIKKVDDKNDSSNAEDTINWRDDADYDVGDIVPYKIVGTVSSTIGDYSQYSYKFIDKMSTGLEYFTDTNHVTKVYMFATKAAAVDATDGTNGTDVTSHFTIAGSGQDLTVTASDTNGLKDIQGVTGTSAFVVFYYAKVTEAAVMGSTGNSNEVYLEFSNNPQGEGIGKTPKDTAIVFTYNVTVNKVEKDTNSNEPNATKPLAGAQFALFKKYTTVNATAAGKSAAPKPAAGITDAQWALETGYVWVAVDGGADPNDATTFKFDRIDDGDYLLVETVTPTGYNTIAPQKFSVIANHVDGELTELKSGNLETGAVIAFTADKTAGSLTTDVLNNSGTTLPSTGGIGTTIFYVIGGVLVLAAIILLVTKKRMSD